MTNQPFAQKIDFQEAIKQQIIKIHGGFNKFEEADFYPEHEKRYETDAYRKIHNHIVTENNAPCVVCGVTSEILKDSVKAKDPKYNYYQATQIELHHYHIEWALANAIDIEKFNHLFLPHLKRLHPDEQLYQQDLTGEQIKDWVDHHTHNLMPLCNVHHRHKYWGIHHTTYPTWSPANLFAQNFVEEIIKAIDAQK